MTIVYFDCFSGISGDMVLGALVDAGVPVEVLRGELAKLELPGYRLTAEQVRRAGIAATQVQVALEQQEQPARRLADIGNLITGSSLAPPVKQKSLAVFRRLAEAEAKVHGATPEEVHFHEVGAVDAIVDIVGAVIGLEQLGATEIIASPVNVGSGSVHTSHGRLPVPAPATAELLTGIPLYSSSVTLELATPTGAALISTLASSFGPLPMMTVSRVAHGAGGRDIPGQPNVLRLLLGASAFHGGEDASVLIETNIDDMNPQVYEHLIERLLQAGAQDAFLTPVIMKKGRPGVLLSVLTDPARSEAAAELIFRETTSIGLRLQQVSRRKLEREVREVATRYGAVRVKVSRRGDEVLTATPEYEDCRRLAEQHNVALKQVMDEARALLTERS